MKNNKLLPRTVDPCQLLDTSFREQHDQYERNLIASLPSSLLLAEELPMTRLIGFVKRNTKLDIVSKG